MLIKRCRVIWGCVMSAVQFIPKADAWPGDRVREIGKTVSIDQMPAVTRLDHGTGVFVADGAGERFVPFAEIDAVLRPIVVRFFDRP